jgi:AraC family transcriptional activator FtrA
MPRPTFTPGVLALIAYDQLRTFEYAIAAEVFALSRPSLGVPWYDSVVVSAEGRKLRGIAGVRIEASRDLRMLRKAKTIVLPGWRDVEERPPVALISALQAAHARGARLLSICSGAFVLAAAGLLDGKRATTHWLFADQLRRQYPKVQVQDDVLYVDEGSIITSAGSAAGIDASLHLVRRDYGARVAPGLRTRSPRHRSALRIREGEPGHPAGCEDVRAAGRIAERILCLGRAAHERSGARGY